MRATLGLFLVGVLAFAASAVSVGSERNKWLDNSNRRGFGFDVLAERDWSFDRAREWGDSAKVDEDSAELVIGVSDVRLDTDGELGRIVTLNGGKIVNRVSIRETLWAVVVDIPFDLIPHFVKTVEATGLAKYMEPNMRFVTQLVPNDPVWSCQWGPRRIEADSAWNTTIGDASVLIAVVDTGIDWNHPDLAANYVALGYDWVNMDSDPMDDQGHGTHVAGTIAATMNNGIGMAGIAQARIMAEKAFDSDGSGYEDDLANALIHAVDQGADILSNSWGGYVQSALTYDAVKYAYDAGVLIVAAAGNDATSNRMYPAAYDEVVAVSATDRFDDLAWFSNFGDWVEVAAPGVDIWSTVWDNNYAYKSGTSMATPHVSGVATLIWSRFPSMTRDEVRAQLRNTADDLGNPSFDNYYGYGRINAREAVQQPAPPPPPPPSVDGVAFRVEPKYTPVKKGDVFSAHVSVYGADYADFTEVYAWQVLMEWNASVLEMADIAFGDFLSKPRIGYWGELIWDAPAGSYEVYVSDSSKYVSGYGLWIKDDFHKETNMILEVRGTRLLLAYPLENSYTVAANGGAYPYPYTLDESDLSKAAWVNNDEGWAMMGVTTLGPAPGVSGDGWLVTLNFNVEQNADTFLNITKDYTYIINTFNEVKGDEPGELNKENGVTARAEDTAANGKIDVVDLYCVGKDWQKSPQQTGQASTTSGAWINPTNAFTSNNLYATGAAASITQVYGSYGIPTAGWTGVAKVEVGLERRIAVGGDDRLKIEISDNGGLSWAALPCAVTPTSTETFSWFDFTAAYSWTVAMIVNIAVRITYERVGTTATTIYVDWIPVRVTPTTLSSNPNSDITRDGTVTTADLTQLASEYGQKYDP